jgi:hypothetical protein
LRHLPRIVSILNSKPEPKNLVRSVFGSVVTTPPQSFGTVTSNLPRVRQSELLTPVELMVLLHESEKEIGVKQAIEGECFSLRQVRQQRGSQGRFFSYRDMFFDDRYLSFGYSGRRYEPTCGRARPPDVVPPHGELDQNQNTPSLH